MGARGLRTTSAEGLPFLLRSLDLLALLCKCCHTGFDGVSHAVGSSELLEPDEIGLTCSPPSNLTATDSSHNSFVGMCSTRAHIANQATAARSSPCDRR